MGMEVRKTSSRDSNVVVSSFQILGPETEEARCSCLVFFWEQKAAVLSNGA